MTPATRLGSTPISAVLLVAVTVVPIIGVAYWDWSLMMILAHRNAGRSLVVP